MQASQSQSRKSIDTSSENAKRFERAVLGCLLETPDLWPAAHLESDDFKSDYHRHIWETLRQLHADGQPADLVTVSSVASNVPSDYIAGLLDDGYVNANFSIYVEGVRSETHNRRFNKLAKLLDEARTEDGRMMLLLEMQQLLQKRTNNKVIRSLPEIPDVLSLKAYHDEPIILDLLNRSTVHLLSGDPGVGKSYLALKIGVSVGLGGRFIGRSCLQMPVLYLDRENPLTLVQKRLHLLAGGPVSGLHVWGNWLNDSPPLIGDPRLLMIAKASPMLIIFDSLVRFHQADENSATEMRTVMAGLRSLVDAGSTVLLLHHRPKSQEILYRGSSDILAAVDSAFSLERDGDDRLKLVAYKSRDSELRNIGICVNFGEGRFDPTNTVAALDQKGRVHILSEIIEGDPGISQNKLLERCGLRRADALSLLRQQEGRLWRIEIGLRNARCYFPIAPTSTCSHDPFPKDAANQSREPVPEVSSTGSDHDSHCMEPVDSTPVVPDFSSPKTGKSEQVARPAGGQPCAARRGRN